MGSDISSLVVGRQTSLRNLSGRVIAIDAFNSLYQFLSIIRQPDGTPLRSREGEITSHLSGLFYRCVNFIEAGIRPVFIFDGVPPELKRGTIEARVAARAEAEVQWQEALAEGDIRRAWSKATRASRLTGTMISDSEKLLELLGVPWVQAPSEGEAQASHMVMTGKAFAAASQDFDSLLFGCPRLIRNLAISGKRRVPRTSRFVNVEPEEIQLGEVLERLGLTREQLVDLAILVGTDYNPGIRGIGPKKALRIVSDFGSVEKAVEMGKIGPIECLDEIREIFLQPRIQENVDITWNRMRRTDIISFMCDRNGFSVDRISVALDRLSENAPQGVPGTTLDRWTS